MIDCTMTDKRETLLRNLLLKIAAEQGYNNPVLKTTAVPTTGSNFSSQLFNATITALGKDNLHVFGKVAVVGEEFRAKGLPAKVYDIERYVYTKLVNIFKEIEERHDVPEEHRLVIPKFYGYSETYLEEVMVLQDLSVEGFTTYDRLKSIDWDYASATVEELAKLHSLSLAFIMEYPDELMEACKVLVWNMDQTSVGAVHQQMNENMVAMVREENRPRLQRFFDEKFDKKTFANFYKPLKRPVIIHSDFRPSNLMHKIDQNGKLQVVIVDYQTLHLGSAVTDLMTFLTCGSDGQFRRRHFDQLMHHYYESMAAALRRLHLDPEEVYPRADFDYELKEILPMMLVMSSLVVPLVTAGQDHMPETGETESFESLVTVDKNNDLCTERLNEIVEDFVRWGII